MSTYQAARMVGAHDRGLITDGELAIQLGRALGFDLRCQLGECPHEPGKCPREER